MKLYHSSGETAFSDSNGQKFYHSDGGIACDFRSKKVFHENGRLAWSLDNNISYYSNGQIVSDSESCVINIGSNIQLNISRYIVYLDFIGNTFTIYEHTKKTCYTCESRYYECDGIYQYLRNKDTNCHSLFNYCCEICASEHDYSDDYVRVNKVGLTRKEQDQQDQLIKEHHFRNEEKKVEESNIIDIFIEKQSKKIDNYLNKQSKKIDNYFDSLYKKIFK